MEGKHTHTHTHTHTEEQPATWNALACLFLSHFFLSFHYCPFFHNSGLQRWEYGSGSEDSVDVCPAMAQSFSATQRIEASFVWVFTVEGSLFKILRVPNSEPDQRGAIPSVIDPTEKK